MREPIERKVDKRKTPEARIRLSILHKGKIPWNKGKIWDEVTKNKIKNTLLGRKRTKKSIENQKLHYKLHGHPRSRVKLSDETKRKIGLANKGNKTRLGKTLSLESRMKMSQSLKGHPSWLKGKKLSEETKEKIRQKRAKQILPLTDTKPERIIQDKLNKEQIEFRKHRITRINKTFHQVDVFIKPNICIEIDGDYWHGRPEIIQRDCEVNESLLLQGFEVLRLPESIIYSDLELCIDKIRSVI